MPQRVWTGLGIGMAIPASCRSVCEGKKIPRLAPAGPCPTVTAGQACLLLRVWAGLGIGMASLLHKEVHMEIRQLITFIQAARMESFSKAAENLGYSQSAVTVQIRLLEQEMNTRLFDRMGKQVMLTPQGRRFLEYANSILYEVNKAKLSIGNEEELTNPLHIGTIESLCSSKLPSIVRHFRQHHPKVTIQITTSSPEELIGMMEHNKLDLIYILDAPRWNNNWNKAMESSERIVFVSSPSFHLAGKKGLLIDELLNEPFFLTEKNANYRMAFDQFLASRHQSLEPLLEISNTAFIIKMLEENDGVSLLPYFAVQRYVAEGRLTILDVTDVDIFMYRQIFYHKNKFKTREMETFIDLALKNG